MWRAKCKPQNLLHPTPCRIFQEVSSYCTESNPCPRSSAAHQVTNRNSDNTHTGAERHPLYYDTPLPISDIATFYIMFQPNGPFNDTAYTWRLSKKDQARSTNNSSTAPPEAHYILPTPASRPQQGGHSIRYGGFKRSRRCRQRFSPRPGEDPRQTHAQTVLTRYHTIVQGSRVEAAINTRGNGIWQHTAALWCCRERKKNQQSRHNHMRRKA